VKYFSSHSVLQLLYC